MSVALSSGARASGHHETKTRVGWSLEIRLVLLLFRPLPGSRTGRKSQPCIGRGSRDPAYAVCTVYNNACIIYLQTPDYSNTAFYYAMLSSSRRHKVTASYFAMAENGILVFGNNTKSECPERKPNAKPQFNTNRPRLSQAPPYASVLGVNRPV